MEQAKLERADVERDRGDEAHLTNNTVRSLTWDIEKVEVGRRLFAEVNSRRLISEINGATMAGMAPFNDRAREVPYFMQEN